MAVSIPDLRINEHLQYLLDEAFCHNAETIDPYALAHYYATLLTDDFCLLYTEAARIGRLMAYDKNHRLVTIPANAFDPTCISLQPEGFRHILHSLIGILDKQLYRKHIWIIDQNTLEKIGNCTAELTIAKIKLIASLAMLS